MVVSKTNEEALEQAIEKSLTGICSEDLKAGIAQLSFGEGYQIGSPDDFNKQYALDERLFWQFLENTQKQELDKLKKHHPNDNIVDLTI